jgi:ribosome-associated protein
MSGEDLARLFAGAAQDKKGIAPVLLDLRGISSITDWFLIVSGGSDRQVQAMTEAVLEAGRAAGERPLGIEGVAAGRWALLDFGDVVVHLFHREQREHYDLERLFPDAPRIGLDGE